MLLDRALAPLAPGDRLTVRGRRPRPRDPAAGLVPRPRRPPRARRRRPSCGATPTGPGGTTPPAPRASHPTSRRTPTPGGASPHGARWSSPAAPPPASTSTAATSSGPTSRPRLYAQAVGEPVGPGDGDRLGGRGSAAARARGGGRAGHDVPRRERDGGARRPGPLPRPRAPVLPRGAAAPRGAGGRRGPTHRGVHPPGAPARRDARRLRGRRAGVAPDAPRRARLRARVVPALRAGRGQLPQPAWRSSTGTLPTRSRPGSRTWHSRTRPATSPTASRTSRTSSPPTRGCGPACAPPWSDATTRWPTPRA